MSEAHLSPRQSISSTAAIRSGCSTWSHRSPAAATTDPDWRLIPDSYLPPATAAGAGLGRWCRFAAAIHDIGAPQVPQGIAPGMHKPTERPDDPDRPGGGRVDLVDHRSGRDRLHIRGAAEEAPEPGRDRRAVVVSVAEQVDADGGG